MVWNIINNRDAAALAGGNCKQSASSLVTAVVAITSPNASSAVTFLIYRRGMLLALELERDKRVVAIICPLIPQKLNVDVD